MEGRLEVLIETVYNLQLVRILNITIEKLYRLSKKEIYRRKHLRSRCDINYHVVARDNLDTEQSLETEVSLSSLMGEGARECLCLGDRLLERLVVVLATVLVYIVFVSLFV